MESGEDENVLKHLLDLEAEATAMVDGAQAEAERRVLEGEKVCRARYDEAYSAEAASLQAAYDNQTASFKEDYKKQLETFRNGLNEMPVNKKQFSALAEHLLLGASPPGEL
jgi:hypothetical protein